MVSKIAQLPDVMTDAQIKEMPGIVPGDRPVMTFTGPDRSFRVYRVQGRGHLLVQMTFLALDPRRWTLMFEGPEPQTYARAARYASVVIGRDVARIWGGEPPVIADDTETYDAFN